MAVVGTVIVICYSTPIFMVVVIPLGILYYLIQVTVGGASLHAPCTAVCLGVGVCALSVSAFSVFHSPQPNSRVITVVT